MNNYALVNAGVVERVTVAESAPAGWIACPYGVSVGWNYDGANWTDQNGNPPPTEPPPKVKYRHLLTGPEWVQTFTDDEWQWIKTQRNTDPSTAATRALDKMMDAIRWTNSVDVSHENMDPFYDWLLNNGIPGGQTRIDELRQGVPV